MSNNSENDNEYQPSKTTGQYHSAKGTVVEIVGNLTGSESWQKSGKQEHASGEAEINAAQAKEYVDGALDRVSGKIDSVTGAFTGDESQQISGNEHHSSGKARMDMNKPENS